MTDKPRESAQQPAEPKTALYASGDDPIVLRPHVYDGIQEYDQKLPNWWLFTFYIMIFWFAVFWLAYYQFDFFKSDEERIQATMASINEKKAEDLQKLLAVLDDKILVAEWSTNSVILDSAENAFAAHCASCHAADLTALGPPSENGTRLPLTGLSLVDGEWKYGSKPMDIFKLIREGTPPDSDGHNDAKMEAWGNTLSSKAIAELTAYIISKNKDEFASYAQ